MREKGGTSGHQTEKRLNTLRRGVAEPTRRKRSETEENGKCSVA